MEFGSFITHHNCPLVFNGMIFDWPAARWNPDYLLQVLQDDIIRCKVGPKYGGVFETDCLYLDVTMADIVNWCNGICQSDNQLSIVDKDKYFCYLDYKNMGEIFEKKPDLLQSVDWSCFGLLNRNGSDSTLWMGSEGASTPCHYDTYGFNLVAQIHGRKRWFLFPPTDSKNMYSTRIPYEESSVYSDINIKQPDFKAHPKFQSCHPYIITLEPGQVLYVPKQWWHYVECVETSISINTWVELEDDKENRLHEAITRIIISSFIPSFNQCLNTDLWINPNEEIQTTSANLSYLQKTMQDLQNKGDNPIDNFKQFCDTFKLFCVFKAMHFGTDSLSSDDKKRKDSNPSLFSEKRIKHTEYKYDGDHNKVFQSNSIIGATKQTIDTLCTESVSVLDESVSISTCLKQTIDSLNTESPLQGSCRMHTPSTGAVHIQELPVFTFSEYLNLLNFSPDTSNCDDNETLATKFVKCVLKPDIIELIAQSFTNQN